MLTFYVNPVSVPHHNMRIKIINNTCVYIRTMLAETSVSVIKTIAVVGGQLIDTHAVTGAFVTLTVVDI